MKLDASRRAGISKFEAEGEASPDRGVEAGGLAAGEPPALEDRNLRRRESAFRAKVGTRLAALKERLGRMKLHWAAEGNLGVLPEVDRLIRRADQVRDAVRFAHSGTDAVLEAVGVPAERLKGLDDLDRLVLDALAWLDAQVAVLHTPMPDRGRMHASVRTLERALADLAALVARRHDYLRGFA